LFLGPERGILAQIRSGFGMLRMMGIRSIKWTSERSVWAEIDMGSSGEVLQDTIRSVLGDGVRSIVPARRGVLIELSAELAGRHAIEEQIAAVLRSVLVKSQGPGMQARTHRIEVCYSPELAPDLEEVARVCGVSIPVLIELHHRAEYVVETIGFVPGFGYLQGLPDPIRIPRRSTPRTHVPAGSVAIVESMSAIYPFASAGGWHLIGRTHCPIFDPQRDPVCMFRVGDRVRFEPITLDAFHAGRAST
jgi:KipI family sensor histidine kinase inhibitor